MAKGVPSRYNMSVRGARGRGRRPPDLPSLILDSRVVYLGMPVRCLYDGWFCWILCVAISLHFLVRLFQLFCSRLLQIFPAVTELIIAEFLWLNFDDSSKPIYLYINSTGTEVSHKMCLYMIICCWLANLVCGKAYCMAAFWVRQSVCTEVVFRGYKVMFYINVAGLF